MNVVESVADLRAQCDAARVAGRRVGFVPTMGYFHVGHRSLMERARAENGLVVVSLFVNPTQFGPGEDLSAYPRDLEADTRVAEAAGVDVLFVPSVDVMYPDGPPRTTVHVAGLTEGMCGAARPTHFDGVTTVVAKLFSMVGPCRAYFGRKDFQQVAVVRRMAIDLDLPVEVIGCPLVREPDGVARSSRNAYLTAPERAAAPGLHAALGAAADRIRAGERRAEAIRELVASVVEAPLELEYVEVRDATDLVSLDELAGSFVIAVAARLGRARLIDNIVMEVDGAAVEVDDGVIIDQDAAR
ncbi:MAG: pantoate--beta-alanine ligase [Acidimicrobiia bacterium]|nr:pantoate--beta-alanine ligase [Acidimicrobiia bacterium]